MRTMADSQYSFSCLAIMLFLLEHDCCFLNFINMLSPLFNLLGEYGVDIMLDEKKRRNGLVLFIWFSILTSLIFLLALCLWCILPSWYLLSLCPSSPSLIFVFLCSIFAWTLVFFFLFFPVPDKGVCWHIAVAIVRRVYHGINVDEMA